MMQKYHHLAPYFRWLLSRGRGSKNNWQIITDYKNYPFHNNILLVMWYSCKSWNIISSNFQLLMTNRAMKRHMVYISLQSRRMWSESIIESKSKSNNFPSPKKQYLITWEGYSTIWVKYTLFMHPMSSTAPWTL